MMNRVIQGVMGALVVLLGFGYLATSCELKEVRAQRLEAQLERDSLAAEAAAERARADGWEVRFGEVTEDLQGELESKDSSLARLARDLRASNVRVEELMEVAVTAGGQVEGQADSVETDPGTEADSARSGRWSGQLEDGLLTAAWIFRLPPASLALDYQVQVPLEFVRGTTGDGRVMVEARSTDPRAEVRVDRLYVDPPPPEIETRTSWTTTLLGTLAGVAGGAAWCPGR